MNTRARSLAVLVASVSILGVTSRCPGPIGFPDPPATRTWDGSGDGSSWFDSDNWNPDGHPAAYDQITVSNAAVSASGDVTVEYGGASGTYATGSITLTGSGTTASIRGLSARDGGTVDVLDGADLTAYDDLWMSDSSEVLVRGSGSYLQGVALYTAGAAELLVEGGGEVHSYHGHIGYSGQTSRVDVSSGGSFSIRDDLRVGQLGSGELKVRSGGSASTGRSTLIGSDTIGSGSVLVEGAGSSFVSGALNSVGTLVVGDYGAGSMTVRDGAEATSNGALHIGWESPATGHLVVENGSYVLAKMPVFFGHDGGHGDLTVTDSTFDCWNHFMVGGRFSGPSSIPSGGTGNVVIENSTLNANGSMNYWSDSTLRVVGDSTIHSGRHAGRIYTYGGRVLIEGRPGTTTEFKASTNGHTLYNGSTGRVSVYNNADAVFRGHIENRADPAEQWPGEDHEFHVGAGSTATFEGDFFGHGVTGEGALMFEAGLSPEEVSYSFGRMMSLGHCDVTLGSAARVTLDLFGPYAFTDREEICTLGPAHLGGTLDVNVHAYVPDRDAQVRLVHAAGGLSGDFGSTELPPLPSGLGWKTIRTDTEYLIEVIGMEVVEPGEHQSAEVGGGAGETGGLEFEFDQVTQGGTLTADYEPTPLDELTSEMVQSMDFILASDPLQMWHLEFDGEFDGTAAVTFCYDDTCLFPGYPEASLEIFHRNDANIWEMLPKLNQDLLANTITVEATDFSPMVIGVPEPLALSLLCVGALALLHRGRRPSGPRPAQRKPPAPRAGPRYQGRCASN